MPGTLAIVLALLGAAPQAMPEGPTRVGTRRVPISYSFSGHQVFLYGQLPPGSNGVFAVMEGPSAGESRLMRKGKVVVFWMGVRQYELAHAPGLYLVNLHCPEANRQGECPHPVPSTIVDLTADRPRIVRAGAISTDQIREVVGGVDE